MDTKELGVPVRRLGASYYSGCRIPFQEFLLMCEEFGMDYLEIQAEHPFTRHDLDSRRIGDVADALSSHQLKVTVHGPLHDMNLSSLKDGIREASVKFTRECIEMTNYLGGSILVIHGGTCPED